MSTRYRVVMQVTINHAVELDADGIAEAQHVGEGMGWEVDKFDTEGGVHIIDVKATAVSELPE